MDTRICRAILATQRRSSHPSENPTGLSVLEADQLRREVVDRFMVGLEISGVSGNQITALSCLGVLQSREQCLQGEDGLSTRCVHRERTHDSIVKLVNHRGRADDQERHQRKREPQASRCDEWCGGLSRQIKPPMHGRAQNRLGLDKSLQSVPSRESYFWTTSGKTGGTSRRELRIGCGKIPKTKIPNVSTPTATRVSGAMTMGVVSPGSFQYMAATTRR